MVGIVVVIAFSFDVGTNFGIHIVIVRHGLIVVYFFQLFIIKYIILLEVAVFLDILDLLKL